MQGGLILLDGQEIVGWLVSNRKGPLSLGHPITSKVTSHPVISSIWSNRGRAVFTLDFLPFPDETQFLGFVRSNFLTFFPHQLSQSQFNRRVQRLWWLVKALRRHWAQALRATQSRPDLPDTKPLPGVGNKRSKTRSDFASTADYGVCASRHLKYFGYKLVLLCSAEGVPVTYELVPTSTDERMAGQQVLDCDWHARVSGTRITSGKIGNGFTGKPATWRS